MQDVLSAILKVRINLNNNKKDSGSSALGNEAQLTSEKSAFDTIALVLLNLVPRPV